MLKTQFRIFVFMVLSVFSTGTLFAQNLGLQAQQEANRRLVQEMLPVAVDLRAQIQSQGAQGSQQQAIPGFPFFFFENAPRQSRPVTTIGSGFIVKKERNTFFILTNQHVVEEASKITVRLHDDRMYEGELLGSDKSFDLAMIKFTVPNGEDTENIGIARLGNSDEVQVGDIVFAIGSPFTFGFSVTQGIVSYNNREGDELSRSFIQTDAAINRGNSGGPLFNIHGEVIGLNNYIATTNGGGNVGIGFAIPINLATKRLPDLEANKEFRYGYIGILAGMIIETMPDFKRDMLLDDQKGVFVASVVENGPAEEAGISPGDYLVAMDNEPITGFSDLKTKILLSSPKDKIRVSFFRNGQQQSTTMTIEEAPLAENLASRQAKSWPGFIPFNITDDLIQRFSLRRANSGVVIASLDQEGAGRVASLQVGDVLLAINGVEINNVADFYREYNKTNSWDLVLNRDGVKVGVFFSR